MPGGDFAAGRAVAAAGRTAVCYCGRAVRAGAGRLRRPCGWAAGRCERGLSGGRFVRSRRCMPPVYAAGRAVRGPEGCCAVLRATKKPTSGNEGRLFCRSGGVCPVRWRAVASVGGRCRCTCRVGRSAVRGGVDRRRRPGPERALSGAGQRGYVLSVRRGGGTGRQSSKETAPASSAVKGTV